MPRAALLKLGALVLVVAAAWWVARVTPLGSYLSAEGLLEGRARLSASAWAPLVFVAVYATATAFALPGSVLTIAGGAVFGLWWGALFNSLGANLGANAAFLLARWLGRDGAAALSQRSLARWMGSQGTAWATRLCDATTRHGFFGLLVLRLVPLVPFNALNFGSGLTPLRWRDYALATLIGIVPGTLVYTFFADALVQGSTEASHDARVRLWIAAGLLLLLSAVPLIARRLGFGSAVERSDS